jgi:hypothetical protein
MTYGFRWSDCIIMGAYQKYSQWSVLMGSFGGGQLINGDGFTTLIIYGWGKQ